MSRVTFKALNRNGYSETVSGVIIDDTGVEITSVKTVHAGMGVFNFQPDAGKRYWLKCTNENGLEKRFELPHANFQAYALTVSSSDQHFNIEVRRSVQASDMPCYLLAVCRGAALYFSEWDSKQGAISFPKEYLPAGVIQMILFDGQMNPLSERLIFSKNDASTPVEFRTDKEVYEKRDKIVSTLSFPDSFSLPLGEGRGGASISVAITDDKDIAVDESTTILSSLLLSSELKGYIENPAYYLQDDYAMDLLMMTHGWRRYNIPEVVKGNIDYPRIPFQMDQEISGQTLSLGFRNPVSGSEIILMSPNELRLSSTDNNGLFFFQELNFPDSTTFILNALRSRNVDRDRLKLVVSDESFPVLNYASQTPIFETMVPATEAELQVKAFIEKAEHRAMYDDDISMVYEIPEVIVTASRTTNDRNEPRLRFWANNGSNQTIRRDELEKRNLTYVADYIAMLVPGAMYVSGRGGPPMVSWRTIEGRGTPVVFVDGFHHPEGWEIPVVEIESIDIFKSGHQFGMIGAGGVISITTRSGWDVPVIKHNYAVYTPLVPYLSNSCNFWQDLQ